MFHLVSGHDISGSQAPPSQQSLIRLSMIFMQSTRRKIWNSCIFASALFFLAFRFESDIGWRFKLIGRLAARCSLGRDLQLESLLRLERDTRRGVLPWMEKTWEESPGWNGLEESAKEKDGPRLEWKGRKDDERRGR
ncbi:hypothetical protein TNCV_4046611 [Trichonephila clavipes]|nr:hypothetical protein TNCV_4046611 [Trichonephila clavipes]